MTGPESLEAFTKAAILVVAGKYDEARAIEMKPSDRALIEKRIEAASANTTKETK